MWEAIKWYCQNGFKELHFGRTEPEHRGLRQFKMGWGAIEHGVDYFKHDLPKNTFIEDNSSVTSYSPTRYSGELLFLCSRLQVLYFIDICLEAPFLTQQTQATYSNPVRPHHFYLLFL